MNVMCKAIFWGRDRKKKSEVSWKFQLPFSESNPKMWVACLSAGSLLASVALLVLCTPIRVKLDVRTGLKARRPRHPLEMAPLAHRLSH